MNGRIIEQVNTRVGIITFDVLIEGRIIPPTVQVLSITTCKDVNRIPTATLVIRDGDAALETFALSSSDLLIPGKTIEIKGGRDGRNSTLFKGIIVRQAIKIRQNQTNLTIECKDEAVKMTIGRKNKYFEETTDSAMIERLIGSYGLNSDVSATTLEHAELVQQNVTDWDFMVMRAEVNGLLVSVDDGKVIVAPPQYQEPDLHLLFGNTIFELDAELDARTQWKEVKTTAWNYSNQSLEEADVAQVDFREQGNITGAQLSDVMGLSAYSLRHSGQLSSSESETWAKAALLKSRMAKIRGRTQCEGVASLKIGQWLDLDGLGTRFNGLAFVSGVRHEFANGAWYTNVQFGVSPEWFASQPHIQDFAAGGVTPSVSGLQIGVVVELENDPKGDDRILVRLPTLDANARGIWSRVACLDAGNNRGSFFRPEIGDEVVVGFINDDPREAIILGQLNSQAKPAPIVATNDNHIKGFTTRSGMHIQFDDEKKIITLDTPAGNSIVIDEDQKSITLKDQNGNKIEMTPTGISLKSPKDITLEATGKINIKATQDASLEGLNTSLKASANLTISGQAGVSVGSSGITKIEGSLVKIN